MGRGPWIPPQRQQTERQRARTEALSLPAQEKLSVEERENIEREIREKKYMVENRDDQELTSVNIDRDPVAMAKMKADIRRKELLLQKDEDLVARGNTKDKIYARIREIEGRIRPYMPTEKEMWAKPGTSESDQAVRKNLDFQRRFGSELQELKMLKRRLESNDPEAGDIEKLRSH